MALVGDTGLTKMETQSLGWRWTGEQVRNLSNITPCSPFPLWSDDVGTCNWGQMTAGLLDWAGPAGALFWLPQSQAPGVWGGGEAGGR